jgi:hypothetical protein
MVFRFLNKLFHPVKKLVLKKALLISSSSPKEMRGLLITVKKKQRVATPCYSDVN